MVSAEKDTVIESTAIKKMLAKSTVKYQLIFGKGINPD
jgi:hypothetical protein